MSQETARPLERKLAATRVWWRATRVVTGLCWIAAVVIALSLLCYHLDRSLALSAQARILWLYGIGTAALLTFLFGLIRPSARRLPDAALAADVEKRYPVLKERLLTTISLLPSLSASGASGLQASGFSRPMTASLAEETQKVAGELNFLRAVDMRPLRNALLAALLLLLGAGADRALSQDAFDNWMNRMKNPAADIAPWALTRVWINPSAKILPTGDSMTVTIETRGIAAERASLRYRMEKENDWKTVDLSKATVVDEPAIKDGHPNAVRRFSYKFSALTQTVFLNATANDGKSNDKTVIVEERPTLIGFQFHLHYPAYMRKPDEELPAPGKGKDSAITDGTINVPVGTEADIRITANKPLQSAEFIHNGKRIGPWAVTNNQIRGHISVWNDGKYTFDLRDKHSFSNPQAAVYEIHAIADRTPDVQITQPTADVDLVPDGSIPLDARATDDHGIVKMGLEYDRTLTDNSTAQSKIKEIGKGALNLFAPNDPQIGKTEAKISARWNLSGIAPEPGETIRFTVTATDADNLRGPHTGKATTYRIRVVSLLEMQRRLKNMMDEENRLMAQLRQRQIDAQNQLTQARLKNDNQALARAQEAERAVAADARSAAQRVSELTTQLENNNFATPSETQRRDSAQKTLEDLAQQKLPTAADTVKNAQESKANSAQRKNNFDQAQNQEDQAKRDIEKAQEELSRIPPPAQLAEEAKRLAQEQRQQADASRYIAENTPRNQLKKDDNALPPEMKVGVQMERKKQADINADTKRLERQLEQAAKAAEERGQKQQADALRRAAEALKQGQAQPNQQSASKELKQNNPSDAAAPQDKAANALEKAAQAAQEAADPNSDSPEAAAAKLEQAAKNLEELAKQQRDAANKVKQNPNSAQSKALSKQERDIQSKAAQEQANLQAAPNAQQSLENASQNLDQSGQKLDKNDSQSAQSPADKAAQQLQKAAQQARNAANQIRQQQAANEFAQKVARLAQDQRAIEAATKRIDAAKKAGSATANDLRELGQLQERQKSTEGKANALADSVPSPAFKTALGRAGKQMHPATNNLNQDVPNTGKDTQTAQDRAAKTLETVADALKAQAEGPKDSNQNAKQGPQSPQEAQAFSALGDLKLAQGLQNEVKKDTGKLDKARPTDPQTKEPKPLTPEQQKEASRLTEGQKETKDITENAGEALKQLPGVEKTIQDATGEMKQAQGKLGDKQTGKPTQTNQENASGKLAQAIKQTEEAIKKMQQQRMAGNGNGPQPGSQPHKKGLMIRGVKNGRRSSPGGPNGDMAALTQRTQRVIHEGQQEQVPAEYQSLRDSYFKALAEGKKK